VREAFIGIAPAVVMAVSFSGELAYEIHVPNAMLYSAYRALQNAGKEFGMGIFGSYAVESMRLEKGYLHWKADLLTEFDPFETSLDRFVDMTKPDFIGKAALVAKGDQPPKTRLVTLEIGTDIAAAHGGASLMVGGEVVGTVSSGDWGYRVNKNLAYAFVKAEHAEIGSKMQIDVIGLMFDATVVERCQYDAPHAIVRG
jgi:dimethylglycine dehydrogenase